MRVIETIVRLRAPALLLAAIGLLASVGCTRPLDAEAEGESVELAILMGELQRHGTKLGFAIRGENRQLADFYLTEVGEVLDELIEVRENEGLPIGATARIIMPPLVGQLRENLAADSWPHSRTAYGHLIDGCNRCHAATEHEYIDILTEPGDSGFAQRFASQPK